MAIPANRRHLSRLEIEAIERREQAELHGWLEQRYRRRDRFFGFAGGRSFFGHWETGTSGTSELSAGSGGVGNEPRIVLEVAMTQAIEQTSPPAPTTSAFKVRRALPARERHGRAVHLLDQFGPAQMTPAKAWTCARNPHITWRP